MPQNTNLNSFPYFDDFNASNNFHRVLFKPGYPVQARELNTLQSILQDQVEKFGTHVFKEGSVVIPGRVQLLANVDSIEFESSYLGLDVSSYLNFLVGKVIVGKDSGVKARIEYYDPFSGFPNLVFIRYLTPSFSDSSVSGAVEFTPGEIITIDENVAITGANITSLKRGQGVGILKEIEEGSLVTVSDGVFFLRGHFISVKQQYRTIAAKSNIETGRIGFRVVESLITSEDDSSLYDNSQGFENFAAPGGDRLKIEAILDYYPLSQIPPNNFVEVMRIVDGKIISQVVANPQYNILAEEFARRTYDESGDYYVEPFTIDIKESLNDGKGNDGLFSRLNDYAELVSGLPPSESLGVYKVSSGKAYVKGFEVEIPSSQTLFFEKPRTTKTFEDSSIPYFTGPSITINRVYGTPVTGFSTSYYITLRDQRVGDNQTSAPGTEIGVARLYDIALESGSYDNVFPDTNQWDLSLYDLQLYTKITLNANVTQSTPTFVKGKASGATGFLRYNVTNSNTLYIYNVSGRFIFGEELYFDDIDTNKIITDVVAYGIDDVKSVYSLDQSKYFSGDLVQYSKENIGQVNITARDTATGISTVSKVNYNFQNSFKENSVVTFTVPGQNIRNASRVVQVSRDSITISGITTVSGLYQGSLYTSTQTPIDFTLNTSKLQSSTDNTYYTPFGKQSVSSVNLTNSELIIRRTFNVQIVSGQVVIAPQELETNETFMPFDEERYILIRDDGQTEILTSDKFRVLSDGKELLISGLGSNSGAKLFATMRKRNIKSKLKYKNRVKSIVIDKSIYSESGIGATTKNDGLVYGNYPYGTRVQDKDICLLYPDVTKIHAIYESNTLGDPELPLFVLQDIVSLNGSAFDTIIGEEFIGTETGAVGMVLEHKSSSEVYIKFLSEKSTLVGETIEFYESGITAVLNNYISPPNKDITNNYILENGQKATSYNYSKIVRKYSYEPPSRKIKIFFEYASIPDSDDGDIITVDSYSQFDYCDIVSVDGIKCSDIIDIRPRVKEYTVSEGKRSPFEFLGRDFSSVENLKTNILAPDESIVLDYSIHLPRIDKIFLSKDNRLQLVTGEPSETPEPPTDIADSIEIVRIYLPPYLCNVNDAKISIKKHKRYQMKDIALLEDRIKNLEYYTSLSLLETNTSNLQIKDAAGLDRFKSGIFVDNFTSNLVQEKKTNPKNAIDITNGELRPASYTTSIDLVLGATSLTGVGGERDPNADPIYARDLIGSGVRRSTIDQETNSYKDGMGIATLDYQSVQFISQLSATRVENVAPYMVAFYTGDISLSPSSDIWVDQVRVKTNTIEGLLDGYAEQEQQIDFRNFNNEAGWSPILWNAWQDNWTGTTVKDDKKTEVSTSIIPGSPGFKDGKVTTTTTTTIRTTTKTGTSNRTGTGTQVKYSQGNTYNLGDKILSVDVASYMRSRNVQFVARGMMPGALLKASLDDIAMSSYVVPKLLPISILEGNFIVGETVIGGQLPSANNNQPYIQFRAAAPNHKFGPFNNPSEVYALDPKNGSEMQTEYTATSEYINVDVASLSLNSSTDFYGYVSDGMVLVGQTSKARAIVVTNGLLTDEKGVAIGSFFIPNPNATNAPKFKTGNAIFKLDHIIDSTSVKGLGKTKALTTYFSQGSITPVQGTVISTRKVDVIRGSFTDSKSLSEVSQSVVDVSVDVQREEPQPIPVPVAPRPLPVPIFVPPRPIPVNIPGPEPRNPPRTPSPSGGGVQPPPPPVRPPVAPPPPPPPVRPPVAPPVAPPPVPRCPATRSEVADRCPKEEKYEFAGVQWDSASKANQAFRTYLQIISSINFGKKDRDTLNKIYDNGPNRINRIYDKSSVERITRDPNADVIGFKLKQDNNGCWVCRQRDKGEERLYIDPLAQSFFVPKPGCFITKLDLFFQSKGSDQESVFVELRPMKYGSPDKTAYPMSRKIINGSEIIVSDNSSAPTTVVFEDPIYLEGGTEHCVVVGSKVTNFTVWISRLGEPDVTTSDNVNDRIPVTSQPTLGSLFKSQNGTTWTSSQYEDLKFNLYKANFGSEGTISFFNPDVPNAKLDENPLFVQSNRIRVGLGTTVNIHSSGKMIVPGNTVYQEGTFATGNYIGGAGIATGSLTVTNSGIGYTPGIGTFTYNNVPLIRITGSGENATANITVTDGEISSATIVSGGNGYVIGDTLTAEDIGNDSLGRNLVLSVGNVFGINELIIDQVQGTFVVGAGKTIKFINSSGINSSFSDVSTVFVNSTPRVISDGLHIKVNHLNHGMHSLTNTVNIFGVVSEENVSEISATYAVNSTDPISLLTTSGFETFENISVSASNPGYIFINNEIISYTGISSNTLTGITRGIDSTIPLEHLSGTSVIKYELNGISLRRINKTHDLQDVTINPPEGKIGLDHYYIKVDTSSNGIDRSQDTAQYPALKFNENKICGLYTVNASKNIQYELIKPIIQTLTLPGTEISSQIRTVTSTSISGNEVSFLDSGYEPISLQENNYFSSPRLIASKLNSDKLLGALPGRKSMEIELTLRTTDANLSPVVDLDRVGAVLVSNRVNSVVTDYINDSRISKLETDPSAFVYATKPIELEIPATSIKTIVSAHINEYCDIRAFFAVTNDPEQLDSLTYYPFPGYTNRIESGELIDIDDNDGTSDKKVVKVSNYAFESSELIFKDYEFSIDNLESFKYFTIKLIGTSTSQSFPPRFREFRTIALA